jgi:protein MpaA
MKILALFAVTALSGSFAQAEVVPMNPPAKEPAQSASATASNPIANEATAVAAADDLSKRCMEALTAFPGKVDKSVLQKACDRVQLSDECSAVSGQPIFHYERMAKDPKAKKVLVFSLIHGDETPAGSVGRYWMERLESFDPRNSWRVIPVLNPDGVKAKTRTNGNNIDINRNFPTKDWNQLATNYWKTKTSSNPRRFPGKEAGSEPETKCAIKHIEEFKPDFIVSVHTPLKVLDFDGPKVTFPKYDYLPWRSLGHFTGSLGRYMWFERQTPVLTMELKEDLPQSLAPLEKLQDVIGSLVKLELKAKQAELQTEEKKIVKTSLN